MFSLISWLGRRFFKMLASDEMRAWYGPDHVCLAAERGAIGTLLISDDLFRYYPSSCLYLSRIHMKTDLVTRKQGRNTYHWWKACNEKVVRW